MPGCRLSERREDSTLSPRRVIVTVSFDPSYPGAPASLPQNKNGGADPVFGGRGGVM